VRRTSQAQTFERRTAELSLSLEGAPNKKVWAVNAQHPPKLMSANMRPHTESFPLDAVIAVVLVWHWILKL
jgi:hypothetical protein